MAPISMIGERCALASKHGEIQVKTNASISIVALFFYLQSAFLFYAITFRQRGQFDKTLAMYFTIFPQQNHTHHSMLHDYSLIPAPNRSQQTGNFYNILQFKVKHNFFSKTHVMDKEAKWLLISRCDINKIFYLLYISFCFHQDIYFLIYYLSLTILVFFGVI